MTERYSKIFSLPQNLYTQGCPIIIAAGSLLKDNLTGFVLAQIKFKRICQKRITAVIVSISASDVSGNPLDGLDEYQYLDVAAKRDECFGQKQAVCLPNPATRSFCVNCKKVIFSDGSFWNAGDAEYAAIPNQTSLVSKLGYLAEQYKRSVTPRARYVPSISQDLWLCACGAINTSEDFRCHICLMKKDEIFSSMDEDFLRQRKSEHDKEQAARKAREEAQKREEEARTKKLIIAIGISFLLIVLLAVLITQVIVPNLKYNSAIDLMESGRYAEAIPSFEELGDFGDSKDKLLECHYEYAEELVKEEQYLQAAKEYRQAKYYKDAVKRAMEMIRKTTKRKTIAAGRYHIVAVKTNGTVVAAGDNEFEQCDVSKWTDVVAVSAYDEHTVGLRSDGTVLATGNNDFGQCDVENWTDIIAVSTGSDFTVGLKSDGTVVATGSNEYGQCDVENWSDIIYVSTALHTVGLKADGTIVTAGYNDFGECEVEHWTDIVSVSADFGQTIGVRSDGSMLSAGWLEYSPREEEWVDVIAAESCDLFCLGLKSDGTVVKAHCINTPGYVEDEVLNAGVWTDVADLSLDNGHCIALKKDGSVVVDVLTWEYGQSEANLWTDIMLP